MIELGGKIDANDLNYVTERYGTPAIARACPIEKDGKINPHVSRFLLTNGKCVSVFHVKPVYYESVSGWRPMEEITSYHGNKRIELNTNWRNATPRFIDWLTKRQKLLGGDLLLPTPFGLIPSRWDVYARPQISLGLTTTTVYPDPNTETTSVDGVVARTVVGETWATIRSGAGTSASDSVAEEDTARLAIDGAGVLWETISRSIYLFDTSSIPDADVISSATFSLVFSSNFSNGLGGGHSFSIVGSTPASNTALASSDYGNLGTTKYATDITFASITVDGTTYTDFALNATGISNVSQTGITKIGERIAADVDNAEPGSHPAGQRARCYAYYADQTGTSKDPKLVVVHAGGGGATPVSVFLMMGV